MKRDPVLSTAASMWPAIIGGAAMAAVLPFIQGLFKGKMTMTAMEKAFAGLVGLLCTKITEQDTEIEKLRKELSERPTKKQIEEAEQQIAKAGAHLVELEKQLEEMSQRRKKRAPKHREPGEEG